MNVRFSMEASRLDPNSSNMKNLPLNYFSSDENQVRKTVSRFAKEEIAPLVKEMDDKGKVEPSLVDSAFKNGCMAINIPVKYGGSGLSKSALSIMSEELAKVDTAFGVIPFVQTGLTCNFINKYGSEEMKQKYLPLTSKEWVSSFCISEATSGSDAFAMKTTAKQDGDDFVINGSKMWILNADLAKLFLVFANANPSIGHRGVTAFLVERSQPGVTVGPPVDKLGLRCAGTCPVHFDNVRVHKTAIIGELHKGYLYAVGGFIESRIGMSAILLGLIQGCFDIAVNYTLERKQFGQLIYDFQGLQHEIARINVEIEAARCLVYNTARMLDAGVATLKDASIVKYYVTELAQKVTRYSIDWMGGVGFTKAFGVEKFYRDCKGTTILEGTSLIQLSTIAKILKDEYSK